MFCLLPLTSCVYSDTITEIIYDQKRGEVIDYDVDPVYVSSRDTDFISEEQPIDSATDAGSNEDQNKDLESSQSPEAAQEEQETPPETPPEDIPEDAPLSDDPSTGAEAEENESESQQGDSLDERGSGDKHDDSVSETPETVAGDMSNSTSATDDSQDANEDNGSSDDTSSDSEENSNNDSQGNNASDSDNGKGNNDFQSSEDGNGGSQSSSGDGGSDDGSSGAGDNGGDDQSAVGRDPGSVFSEEGADAELPKNVRRVAAVGNAAIVVAALGGADGDPNLVAADSNLLSSNASSVLANRGIDSAQIAWSSDGTSDGQVDMGLLLSLELDACVISSGDDTLSKADQQTLMDEGVNIVFVPNMDSPEGIVSCVRRIAVMLAEGGDASAAGVANGYFGLYDRISEHVSGLDPAGVCALYVDKWMDGVTYRGPLSSELTVYGVAMAPIGLSAQPVSTYLGVAGVVNPAIEKVRYQLRTGRAVVWPFIGGTNDSDWAGIANVNGGKGTTGNDFELALTRLTQNDANFDLGSPAYPALIARSATVKREIEEDRGREGIYSAEAHASSSIVSDDYEVLINPHGIFSSWADGSVESVLEAAWASSVFQPGGDVGFLEDCVRSLYSDMYGYDLGGSYADVVNGTFAE